MPPRRRNGDNMRLYNMSAPQGFDGHLTRNFNQGQVVDQNRQNFDSMVRRAINNQTGNEKLQLTVTLDQRTSLRSGLTLRQRRGKQFTANLSVLGKQPARISMDRLNTKRNGVLTRRAQKDRRDLINKLWDDLQKMVEYANEQYQNTLGHTGFEVAGLTLKAFPVRPVGGGEYTPLPYALQHRYCVFNPKTDTNCFAYCIAAHQHPQRHKNRLSGYRKHILKLPDYVQLNQLLAIERKYGIQVNVYGVTPSKTEGYFPYLVYPHDERAAKRDMNKVIPLILYKGHYSLITNFTQFATCGKGDHVCPACLQPVTDSVAHANTCSKFPPMRMIPAKTKYLTYNELSTPKHMIVADFECMLPKSGKHVPSAWCMQVLDSGIIHEGFGPQSVRHFIDCVMTYASELTVCAFHNLRGYDSHLIIEYLANSDVPYRLDILPASEEKVIGFTLSKSRCEMVRFIDSASLMPASLDNLLKAAGKEEKLFYPYEYMDDWTKYEETQLPPIEKFYSSLKESSINQEEYESAQELMRTCKTLKEYTMVYMRRDVVGLAEVMSEFRRLTKDTYNVDPCAYWSLPGVSWAAMLQFTDIKIETVPPEMYQWLESGVRGGLSVVSKHRATSTDKDSIVYFDANNLYGWALSEPLPVDEYEFVDEWVKDPSGKYGHIIEVDLEYPTHLHSVPAHQQYPLAVVPRVCADKTTKLCGTFEPKKNYVVHERALEYYIQKGLQVTKIHKVLRFRQEAWLKPYIEKNSALRAKSVNDFESDFYKLMNNAVFGKTLESPRNRCTMRLFEDSEKFKRYASQPQFVTAKRLGERYLMANSMRTQMVCNKVPAVGVTILDLAKLHMAKWHYDVVMPRIPQAEMCATDTDSFFYHVPGMKEDEIYEKLKETLDRSNFDKDHHLYDSSVKKVPGYFKSEVPPPNTITDAVWLRAKMYSYVTRKEDKDGNEINIEKKRAKGVMTGYVDKHLTHDAYVQCLEGRADCITAPHARIISTQHNIRTEMFTKVGLSCFDDKRIQSEDHIHTYPHGIKATI